MQSRQLVFIFFIISLFICSSSAKKLKARMNQSLDLSAYKIGTVKDIVIMDYYHFYQRGSTSGISLNQQDYNLLKQIQTCQAATSFNFLGVKYMWLRCDPNGGSMFRSRDAQQYLQVANIRGWMVACTSSNQFDCQKSINSLDAVIN